MRKSFAFLFFFWLLIPAFGLNFGKNTIVSAPPFQKPPVIDGVLSPEEWSHAAKIAGGGRIIDGRLVEFWIGYDKQNFYFAIRSELPPDGKLVANAFGGIEIFKDDSIELMILPPDERKPGARQFGKFQLFLNSSGAVFGQHIEPGWGLSDEEWNVPLTQKHRLENGFWTAEFSLPVTELGVDSVSIPSQWRFIVSRNFQHPFRQAAWTPAVWFNQKNEMGVLQCAEDAPVTQFSFSDWNRGGTVSELLVINPSKCEMKLTYLHDCNGTKEIKRNITLKPGEKTLFKETIQNSDEKFSLRTVVRNVAGDYCFRRVAEFEKFPKKRWTTLAASELYSLKGTPRQVKNGKNIPTGQRLSLPAALYLKFRTLQDLPPGGTRIFLQSKFSPEGYFFLHESEKYFLLGFQYFSWKKDRNTAAITWQKKGPLKGTQRILVNLFNDSAVFYFNGEEVGALRFGAKMNAVPGELLLGNPGIVNNFEVDDFRIYDHALLPEEIAQTGLTGGGIKGKISYFPTLNELIVEGECNPYELPKNLRLFMVLEDASGKELKKEEYFFDRDFRKDRKGMHFSQKRFELPLLKDGDYKAFIRMQSQDGTENVFLLKNFTVKKYEWENNTLGLSRTIVPPFVPLKLSGNMVETLLKKYTIGANGLPSEVYSENESILAHPVSYEMIHDGQKLDWHFEDPVFSKAEKDTVSYRSEAKNKAVRLVLSGNFEYDGLLTVRLKVIPEKFPFSVARLSVDIPVRKEIAELFHAAGSGNRSNPAGKLPSGTGRLWGCRSLPHILKNFVPYIWIGGVGKGICYAADSDKDWVHSEKKEDNSVEIIRMPSGDLSIRLNLLNHAVLKRPHEMEFCLMATPVKPMPKDWRAWSDNYSNFKLPGRRFMQALYATQYFGSYFDAMSFYPAFHDYEIVRKLSETRRTGKIDMDYIEKYVKRVMKAPLEDVPWRENRSEKDVRVSLLCGFNQAKGLADAKPANTVLYYYTCCYEQAKILPEFKVYGDEWQYSRNCHMVKSYRDFCVWHAAKMFDNGMDGIYLDNTALAVRFDWPTGEGYLDDDGNVHPSFGFWRMRNYVKRLATLFAEKGKVPFIWVHDTNSLYLPAFSFASATMDLEWKYGDADYQDRYGADYLLAVVAGRQGGFFPAAIDGIKADDSAKRTWLTRTMLAAFLPHEIQPTVWISQGSDVKLMRKIYQILWDFGKAEADTVFTGYWEKNLPFTVDNPKLLVSSYVRKNKVLLVIGNYGGDSENTIRLKMPVRSVINAETGEKLPTYDREVRFPLKKHDFLLMEVSL